MTEKIKLSYPFLKDIFYKLNNPKNLITHSKLSVLGIIQLTKAFKDKVRKEKYLYDPTDQESLLVNCMQSNCILEPNSLSFQLMDKLERGKEKEYLNHVGELSPLPKILFNNSNYNPKNCMNRYKNYPILNKNMKNKEINEKSLRSNSLVTNRNNDNLNNEKNYISETIFINKSKSNNKNYKNFSSINNINDNKYSNLNNNNNIINNMSISFNNKDLKIDNINSLNKQSINIMKVSLNEKKNLFNIALNPRSRELEIRNRYQMNNSNLDQLISNNLNNKVDFNLLNNSNSANNMDNDVINKIDKQIFYNKVNNNHSNSNSKEKNEIFENNKINYINNKQSLIIDNCNSIKKKFIENNSLDLKNNKNHSLKKINPQNLITSFRVKRNERPKLLPLSQISDFKNEYNSEEFIIKKYFNSEKIINFQKCILPPIIGQPQEKFYYSINKMYCKQLTEYMKHRINWEYIDSKSKLLIENKNITINFKWKYYSNRLNFKEFKYDSTIPSRKLKMVNVFERNNEIGNKRNMFINFILYCDKININAFQYVPLTITINNSKDVDNYLESLKELIDFVDSKKNSNTDIITNRKYNDHFWFDKNYETLNNQYLFINKNYLSNKNYWILKPTDLYQGKCIEISNNFEEIFKKCKNMFKGVDRRLMPDLIANAEEEDSEEENINLNQINVINGSYNEIIKTEENLNISNINNNLGNSNLCENLNINNSNNSLFNYKQQTKKKKKNNFCRMYCSNEIIVQKYLDNPLLYKKRKFDIRCFVLVDSNLNVFFCREGHLKGSSELYNINNTNKFIHITNHSLQKKSNKFEIYEYGNEMSYNDFKNFMKEENIPLEKFDKMIKKMEFLVEISFKSVGKKLTKINPVLCFEIFGYDFILDSDFNPWILEINNNPGLGISSPVIQKLVPRMLDDAFRLTIDKVFDTKYSEDVIDENGNYKSKYQLDGFNDEENVFEFLCNVG